MKDVHFPDAVRENVPRFPQLLPESAVEAQLAQTLAAAFRGGFPLQQGEHEQAVQQPFRSFHDENAFSESQQADGHRKDLLGLLFFVNRQGFHVPFVKGVAAFLPRAFLAAGRRGRTKSRAQLHQRLIEIPGTVRRHQRQYLLTETLLHGGRAYILPDAQKATDDPIDIAVHRRGGLMKGNAGDRAGCISANAGQF